MSDSQKIVAILVPLAYLLGAIPFGLVVGLLKEMRAEIGEAAVDAAGAISDTV